MLRLPDLGEAGVVTGQKGSLAQQGGMSRFPLKANGEVEFSFTQ